MQVGCWHAMKNCKHQTTVTTETSYANLHNILVQLLCIPNHIHFGSSGTLVKEHCSLPTAAGLPGVPSLGGRSPLNTRVAFRFRQPVCAKSLTTAGKRARENEAAQHFPSPVSGAPSGPETGDGSTCGNRNVVHILDLFWGARICLCGVGRHP